MALIKKSRLTRGGSAPAGQQASATPAKAAAKTVPTARGNGAALRPAAGHGKVSERLAAATEELASGLTQSSAAVEELRRSMDQIAAGAAEAAGASQEQFAAIKRIVSALATARGQADTARRRTEAAEVTLAETAIQITSSARAIERNGRRQGESVAMVAELERRAGEIGDITRSVSRIADRTNLLALNAAIEAARAGEQGRGFAVVADEVRALAESSEKSSREVQTLAASMQTEVRTAAQALQKAAEVAVGEATAASAITTALNGLRDDLRLIAGAAEQTVDNSIEAERAAGEAQKGAELVATAAEEQSAAANESQAAIQEQAKSLEQGQSAARLLANSAEKIRASGGSAAAAQDISATAEELSASIQELSGASQQIMTALSQITAGSQQQAAATQQTSAALTQIEKSARAAQNNAAQANERVVRIGVATKEAAGAVDKMVSGVETALSDTRNSILIFGRLETVGRRVEKVVGGISLIVVQTTMLAVSGAVEAARAGEQGRGFATVSNDIRSLAREAADSADTIKETVAGILDQIAAVRRDLEQIVGAVDIEAQTNRTLLGSFEKVNEEVTTLASANREIEQGAESILSATVEVAAGARQIASAAEEAGSASRQAATASTQQARGAEDLAAAVEEIASLADELKRERS